jgi:hypothetical protein
MPEDESKYSPVKIMTNLIDTAKIEAFHHHVRT